MVLERLAAAGRLAEGQLAVARAVLPQLEFGIRGAVGGASLAAALLQLAVRAGGCNITQREAAAAVGNVGGAVSVEAVRHWRERCQEAWEVSEAPANAANACPAVGTPQSTPWGGVCSHGLPAPAPPPAAPAG